MDLDPYLIAVILLAFIAIFDLMVGVSNDAVNFLNSSIGSRVAPRVAILIIASIGLVVGVSFSGGMMEVARKGIFRPQLFSMPELLSLFVAVMLTDIILLDLFNTYGFPTSTTVSIVFELLGAAVAISVIKILQEGADLGELINYINTGKAMLIIFGILLSVVVAFFFGAVVQVLSRLLFTFDYKSRLTRYGGLWGAAALASIVYFILVKGAKGSTIISSEGAAWIQSHTLLILGAIFLVSAIFLQILLFMKFNILKLVVIVGTFALAMAFAANDLVNFIGVPLAGWQAYKMASASDDPLTASMAALDGKVATQTYLLILAGGVMAITLFISRKARTVTETEIRLGQQSEAEEGFESFFLSRIIVRAVFGVFSRVWHIIPSALRDTLERRMQPSDSPDRSASASPFDLLRASVNLTVASAVISYATSHKLPLSTTYVTFMAAMGASFGDMAWGRDSAVYRVTGVLAVITGWFLTAFAAFTISCAFASLIYFTSGYGVLLLTVIAGLVIWRNHHRHADRQYDDELEQVFNFEDVTDARETVTTTFVQIAVLLQQMRESLDRTLDALFAQDERALRSEKQHVKRIQRWTNIITANIFKALRLLQRSEADIPFKYGQTARRLQKLADGHRDIVLRGYHHVSNHHKGMLPIQISELDEVKGLMGRALKSVEMILRHDPAAIPATVKQTESALQALAERLDAAQVDRVGDGSSKTRLTILYYAIVGNALMICKQNARLLESFEESFGAERASEFEMD